MAMSLSAPIHLRLEYLPVEILAFIRLLSHTPPFEALSTEGDEEEGVKPVSPQSQCQLQLVSRWFRNLELNLPELWTHVDIERMSLDRIQLQIQRSKTLGLSLHLSIGQTPSRNSSFLRCICKHLDVISKYAHRWSNCVMGIQGIPRALGNVEDDHLCIDKLRHAEFPSVSRAVVDCVDGDAQSVVKTWSFANLEYLKAYGVESALACLQHTASLHTLDWLVECHPFTELSFMESLQSVSSTLRSLRVDWFNIECLGEPAGHVNLSSLKKFTMIDSDPEDEPERILQMFQRIDMPVLVTLSLKLHMSMCYTDEFMPWLKSLKNPGLKEVDVVITEARYNLPIGDSIRKVLLEPTKPRDLHLNVTLEQLTDPQQDWEVGSEYSSVYHSASEGSDSF